MNYDWTDFIGNVGVALILIAYLMLQFEKIDSRKAPYSLLNGIGAALILFSLCFDFNLSAFVIEFFWLLISIVGLIRGICRRMT